MLTDLQRRAAQAIVNIFETGRVLGNYAAVTLIPGDSGHLTYGRSQTTLASGNLHLLIADYCNATGARLATALAPFLPRLKERDFTLDFDIHLHSILRDAGADPVMRSVQDAFFDRVYWSPALAAAAALQLTSPLASAVVYDSFIHGSFGMIRQRTSATFGLPEQIGEKAWVEHFVETRRNWLANHSRADLRKTVYRMISFQGLIRDARWDLPLPLSVRGVTIDQNALDGLHAAPAPTQRLLKLRSPHISGDDVRSLQRALTATGHPVNETGYYDDATAAAVIAFQRAHGLVPDGIVGDITRNVLGIRSRSTSG